MVLYLSHLHEESKRRLIIISLVRSVKTQTYSSFYAIYKRLHLSNKSKVAQTTPSSQPKILTLPIALNNLFLSIRWSFCICHGSGVSTRLKKKSFICHAKKVNERREPVTRSVYQSPDTYEYINVMWIGISPSWFTDLLALWVWPFFEIHGRVQRFKRLTWEKKAMN